MAGIAVEGNRTISSDELASRIGFTAGKRYGAPDIDQAIVALMRSGLFRNVAIESRAGRLHILVEENPIVASVGFEGNSAVDKKRLEETARLKPKERYTPARSNADAVAIRELYRGLGRMRTTIEPRTAKRSDERVDVIFAIKEGPVDKIERIGFAGHRAFSERQLKDVIVTSESGWLDIFKSAAFYDPARVETDRLLLQRFFQDKGFPDGRVTQVEAVRNGTGDAYVLTFHIDEGEPRRFDAPRVESHVPGLDGALLLPKAHVVQGQPFSRERIDRSIEAMTEELNLRRQPFARVKPSISHDGPGGTASVVFHVEQGSPLHVERIDISGNVRTKDHVVRRELKLAEGDPVNAFLIERARRRLVKLGFFKSVEIKPGAGSAPDKTTLTITVIEEETGNLSFGGGYSTSEGIIGDISWTERNLLGNGQYLRLKLAGSLTRLQADIGSTEPRFLGSNVSAGFDLFYTDVDRTQQSSYKYRKVGGDLRLGFPVSDETTTGLTYTFTRNTLYDVGANASVAIREAVPGYPSNTSNSYDTSSIGSSVTFDNRDSKKRPTTGLTYTLSQDLAGVGGDVRFVRSTGDVRGYYPVADGITLMGRLSGGFVQGWGGQDVKLLDLFYRGGETVRGFATAGIGPRDTQSTNQDALGGKMYIATTAETLFDIPGVPRDLGVRAAVFADAGSLWGTNTTAAALPGLAGAAPQLRASAGVGLVWDSPLGGLRADYALPLVSQSYDKLQPFSFGMTGF
ncbi:MAG: outer membrane protein assembly factor BamA [Hyphomicrobiaceae bacterium]